MKKRIKKAKPKYNQGGIQQEYLQSQQQGAMLSGIVGKINPIVGLGMKAGQMIGTQTMDSNGIYKSKAGQFLDNSINPSTGIQNLKDLAKDPSGSNIANQLSLGLIGKGATQKKREKALLEQKALDQNAFRNAQPGFQTMPTFKQGGKLTAGDVVGGGSVESISPDAVQVKANNPNQIDSVELDNAFVDHNEVIDRKDRVFSDSLRAPSGRTIAKEAARLEKMKNNNRRFESSNKHIDAKLDKLFAFQEEIKKPRKVAGGLLTEDPVAAPALKAGVASTTYGKMNPNVAPEQNFNTALSNLHKAQRLKNSLVPDSNQRVLTPEEIRLRQTMGNPDRLTDFTGQERFKMDSVLSTREQVLRSNPKWFKPNQAKGGFLGEDPLAPAGSTKVQLYQNPWENPKLGGNPLSTAPTKINPLADLQTKTSPNFSFMPDWQSQANVNTAPLMKTNIKPITKETFKGVDVPLGGFKKTGFLAGAAQFGSDAINAYLTSKTAKPKAPSLEGRVDLGRVSADGQLAENARQTANANRSVRQLTSQASQALSNQGANLAKRMYADNQVNQAVQNQNTELVGREAFLNSQINARNTERKNQFKQDTVAAKNQKLSNYSQIASNVGDKAMQMKRESNMKEYDRMYLDVLRQKYRDSKLDERFIDMIMKKKEEAAYKTGFFKYGGKLPKIKKGK